MNKVLQMLITALAFSNAVSYADNASDIYKTTMSLEGDWILSSADVQQGKATKHKLVAPLVGTDTVAMNFKLVGKGSTVQETLLPGSKKEMVSMYHCKDPSCSQVKATHYCAKQNQPELVASLESTSNQLVYDCDMTTELCKSGRDHIHRITHNISNDGKHLTTTYTSWKDGKYLKDSTYHFDRK